jgi:hypothetical protein
VGRGAGLTGRGNSIGLRQTGHSSRSIHLATIGA